MRKIKWRLHQFRKIRVMLQNGEQILVSRMYSDELRKRLGKKGLSMSTLLQLFVLAMIISVGQIIFFTMVFFCCAFSWFPISDVKAWIGFIVSFSVCTSIGIVVCRMKEKAENKKMAQALQTIKSGESEYED